MQFAIYLFYMRTSRKKQKLAITFFRTPKCSKRRRRTTKPTGAPLCPRAFVLTADTSPPHYEADGRAAVYPRLRTHTADTSPPHYEADGRIAVSPRLRTHTADTSQSRYEADERAAVSFVFNTRDGGGERSSSRRIPPTGGALREAHSPVN
jgi:hypothetical protein